MTALSAARPEADARLHVRVAEWTLVELLASLSPGRRESKGKVRRRLVAAAQMRDQMLSLGWLNLNGEPRQADVVLAALINLAQKAADPDAESVALRSAYSDLALLRERRYGRDLFLLRQRFPWLVQPEVSPHGRKGLASQSPRSPNGPYGRTRCSHIGKCLCPGY